MPKRLSRRTFLRGAGGVSVALPLLDAMRTGPAWAAGPQRYIQIAHPLGFRPVNWYTKTGTDGFVLKDFAGALRPHASDLLLLRGSTQWNNAAGHHEGHGATFTGQGIDVGYGISLDQQIANIIDHKPFKSLFFGMFAPIPNPAAVSQGDGSMGYTTVFSGPKSPIPPENNPAKMFSTLFAGRTGGPALADAQARRKSILDLVRSDFQDIQIGLSAADKRRVAMHAELLRAVEIEAVDLGTTCASPNAQDFQVTLDETQGARVATAQMDLLALSMACDLTRVAALQFNFSMGGMKYAWLESRIKGISASNLHGFTHERTAAKDACFLEIEKWYIEQVAYLTTRLKQLGVFDGTVMLWTTNEGRGYHEPGDEEGRADLMYVLIGSGGGAYRTGRVYDSQRDMGYVDPKKAVTLNCILLNVARAFGYTGTTFGSAYQCQSGPAPING